MPEMIDRRRFIKRAGATAVALSAAPLIRPASAPPPRPIGWSSPSASGAPRRPSPGGTRRPRSPCGTTSTTRSSSATRRPSRTARARHRVEAVERDAHVDVQAALRRDVPRGLRRDDLRGRQVHGRAELQARCASAAPPTSSATTSTRSRRPTSSRWCMHFKTPAVDGAVAVLPVRRLPERHRRRSTWSRSASRRRRSIRSAPAPTATSRASRATIHRFEAVPDHWRQARRRSRSC